MKVFIFAILFLLIASCSSHKEERELRAKEIKFKGWVADTLRQMDMTNVVDIALSTDSLALWVYKTFNKRVTLDSIEHYCKADTELDVALWHLDNIDDMPKKDFQLSFTIEYVTNLSPVEQLFKEFFWLYNDFTVIVETDTIKYDVYRGGVRGRLH